jgi:hypothetical protein
MCNMWRLKKKNQELKLFLWNTNLLLEKSRSFRNIVVSVADFCSICQNISTYLKKGRDTYTSISKIGNKNWESEIEVRLLKNIKLRLGWKRNFAEMSQIFDEIAQHFAEINKVWKDIFLYEILRNFVFSQSFVTCLSFFSDISFREIFLQPV